MTSERGVTLVETLIAMIVLTVGAVGLASAFLFAMQSATTSPNELVATQKAAEAVESVFSARDSHTITWAQLHNVADGGIFLDGAQPMNTSGEDGIINTGDTGEALETVTLPGPDQLLGTADDTTQDLTGFTREITITDIGSSTSTLREIQVTVTYPAGTTTRTYTLTTYISAFA
ncbi:MAG TPA: prepilin-type N-terminal cleavage/methylation domain-containing protein [Vicinamibacterales bacterium]|nr:prepilin-type N-terminal cleavage/methylation domain-containing protein [Vicinamibacterales bacterium]